MKRHLKTALGIVILAATVLAFIYYCRAHPAIITQLRHIPPLTLLTLVALYSVWFMALALVTRASLQLYRKHMALQENFLFNAYSSLINFFGPGQSGPIFRGAYLKKRHGLGVKQYLFTLLVYYAFYAVISVLMMFIGTRPWWQTVLVVLAVAGASIIVLRWYSRRNARTLGDRPLLNVPNLVFLCIITAVQLGVQAIIFGIELHTISGGASIGHILAYTGVANFALFVALTPGAIGIREAFLAFSQGLHHINGPTIVAANIVDRAAFLVFLGILFVLVISLHARDKLQVTQLPLDPPKAS